MQNEEDYLMYLALQVLNFQKIFFLAFIPYNLPDLSELVLMDYNNYVYFPNFTIKHRYFYKICESYI